MKSDYLGVDMFKTNEYFDGNVVSIAFETGQGPATVGVMAAGEYEFGTSTIEYMTVTSGSMTVRLPGSDTWETYEQGRTFVVEKDKKFAVRIESDTAYMCVYK